MTNNDPIFDHERLECPPDIEYTTEQLLPVVVGAHPRAELGDRPWAGKLVRVMRHALRERGQAAGEGLLPLVVSDVWFLNDEALMRQPVIALGDPGVNAASAYFATRLPATYAVENACQVLLDPKLYDLKACLWGVNDESMAAAVEYFQKKWLGPFLEAAELSVDV